MWADGSSFDGDWKRNMINGFGKYKWSDGRSYEGLWKDNKMHGNGLYKWNGK